MLGVTVWACGCGVRYKAILETRVMPENKTEVACPRCETVTQVLGTPEYIFQEVAQGQWRAVRMNSGIGQSLR